mmetsp:Transcript_2628/g.10165  ORF Transcript_2628/g.10165 Transcript_2628/m.10165 type:complete len:253 (+) Transcript_2628:829-1587(+)
MPNRGAQGQSCIATARRGRGERIRPMPTRGAQAARGRLQVLWTAVGERVSGVSEGSAEPTGRGVDHRRIQGGVRQREAVAAATANTHCAICPRTSRLPRRRGRGQRRGGRARGVGLGLRVGGPAGHLLLPIGHVSALHPGVHLQRRCTWPPLGLLLQHRLQEGADLLREAIMRRQPGRIALDDSSHQIPDREVLLGCLLIHVRVATREALNESQTQTPQVGIVLVLLAYDALWRHVVDCPNHGLLASLRQLV